MIQQRGSSGGPIAALVLGAAVCAALITWGLVNAFASAASRTAQIHRSVAASGDTMTVSLDSEDLTLAVSDDGRVHLDGRVSYRVQPPSVEIATSSSGLSVTVSCTGLVDDGCSGSLTLAVPAHVAVSAATASGNLTAASLDNLSLRSDSGDLRVSDAAGSLSLETLSGDITGAGLSAAAVTADDDSGDVSLSFIAIPDQVSVQDASGDATVLLPPGGPAYAVDARSLSGDSSIGVPTDPASAHVISVTVDSGDVSVAPGA